MKKANKVLLLLISLLMMTSCITAVFYNRPMAAVLSMSSLLSVLILYAVRRGKYSYQHTPDKQEQEETKGNLVTKTNISFDSVAGMEEIKEELEEVADFLKSPEKYKKFGAKIPKGILFYGPPGTGKTLIARALATETDSNFIYASGSEFIEKFVGVGASRIRSLFEKAEKKVPCIIFIDEIDAIGVSRNTDNNSERDQTLNQLLIELDGFNQNEGVVIVGATNRIDMLDQALLRPGRFDRHIYVGNPCVNAREKILKVHLKDKPVSESLDLRKVALKTSGLSGAHLANIANEAALLSIRKKKSVISDEEINEAIIKTTAGLKNANMILTEEERHTVAFHESAHALAECILNDSIPERITIIPHGQSLGFMMADKAEDKFLLDQSDLENKICVLLAGRAAEEIVFDKITTGAQNDLEKANELANMMVCEYGMSQYKNRIFNKQSDAFLSQEINQEITRILDGCYMRVIRLLNEKMDVLSRLAEQLYAKELLKQNEIQKIIQTVFV
mgnify:CR=1 FL=1